MNTAESLPQVDEQSARTIVRIDAQEEEFVSPIREYLESNGCEVFVNQTTNSQPTYHIVTGDLSFVKSIFSSHQHTAVPKLGIVLGSGVFDAQKVLQNLCKIVVVDPIHLTPGEVVEIFSFFFAGNKTVFDKRRNVHEPAPVVANVSTIINSKSIDISDEDVLPVTDRQRIGNIISDVFADEQQMMQNGKPMKHRRRKMKKNFLLTLAFCIIVCLFPVLWYGASVGISAASFALGGKELKQKNISGGQRYVVIGNYWLHQAKFSFGLISFPFRMVGSMASVRGQERLLSFLSDMSVAFSDVFVIAQNGRDVATLLLTNSASGISESPASAIDKLHISVVSVSGTLGLAQAQLATLLRDRTFPCSISPVFTIASQALTTLETLRGSFTYVDELLTLYPNIAGFKEPKTYLILLQNSNELRPTGGFIGSVGIAKFEDGVLADFSIQDVYALDGQLKGHVDPPAPLRDLLGAEHWYLRDSNWDPDFRESGERAAWFYKKETGTSVDGVIAINVPVVVDLLSATGPIFLPDYNDRISADNFFGKSFYYTQNNFFPGSTQKSDFLGTLARSLITTVTQEKTINPMSLFHAITAGLMRKDILFMFADNNLEQLVEQFGWGGRVLTDGGCNGVEKTACTFDPLIFAEANVSVSKVNYFVKRSTLREITIAPDGTITESVSLTIRNTSDVIPEDKTQGVGGVYIPYIRFFVPHGTQVHDVTLDGQPIRTRTPQEKGAPTLPYIENTTITSTLLGIGIASTISPGTEHTIRLTLSRTNPMSFGRGGGILDLLYYKHPGISDENIKTIIRYPLYWTVTPASKGQTYLAKEGQLEYNSTILQDQIIRLQFAK